MPPAALRGNGWGGAERPRTVAVPAIRPRPLKRATLALVPPSVPKSRMRRPSWNLSLGLLQGCSVTAPWPDALMRTKAPVSEPSRMAVWRVGAGTAAVAAGRSRDRERAQRKEQEKPDEQDVRPAAPSR